MKSSKLKWKAFFILFKGFSVAKNCLRSEIAPLKKTGTLVSTENGCKSVIKAAKICDDEVQKRLHFVELDTQFKDRMSCQYSFKSTQYRFKLN